MQSSVPHYETLPDVSERQIQAQLRTLKLHIPRFHNPDECGRRRKCSFSKLKLTLREIRELFTGYSVTSTKGWNSDDRVRDSHYRFEMDFLETPELMEKIQEWKLVLENRFEQRSIYMALSLSRWL
jgi:hypothetical protein